MKVSYNWLQEYFKDKLPLPEKVAEDLTMHSFELESTEKIGDDFIFDIKILPERAHDCLSHVGIAKEITAVSGLKLKENIFAESDTEKESKLLSAEIADEKLCRRYSSAVIKGVKVGPSPEWLKNKLEYLGQKSINNIVDATNYVMFAIGQPLHAFDVDKMKVKDGKYKITVKELPEDESFIALDNKEYKLLKGMLVITDGNSGSVLGLAGIKGGKKAEIDEKTANIILESANFDPVNIRKTSKNLSLRTEASHRFENEITPEITNQALQEVVRVILDIASGNKAEVEGYFDFYPKKPAIQKKGVLLSEINSLLGAEIKEDEVKDILNRSGFEWKEENKKFVVTVPPERLDLENKQGLVRQIGRIYGYYKINTQAISKSSGHVINKRFYYSMKVSQFLAGMGFSEVYTYSFTDKKNGKVEIENPLASDKNFLRVSLVPGLAQSLELNLRNAPLLGKDEIKIFEIGKVFDESGKEKHMLGIAYGSKNSKIKSADVEKFLTEIKDEILKNLGLPSADFILKGNVLEMDFDKLVQSLPDPKSEIELNYKAKNARYKKISTYPFVARDIAVFVPQGVKESELSEIINREAGELLVNLKLFDVFEKKLPDGTVKSSYAFRLVFQSMEKTLFDEEINKIMEKITGIFNGKPGCQVR